jgi:hypothetical protein
LAKTEGATGRHGAGHIKSLSAAISPCVQFGKPPRSSNYTQAEVDEWVMLMQGTREYVRIPGHIVL